MSRHASLRLAVATACLAVLPVAGACADAVRLTPGQAADAAGRLDLLSEQIGGTPRQRTAGAVLQHHRYQDPLRECMAGAGFAYAPPAFADPYQGMSRIPMGIGTGLWLAPLNEQSLGVSDAAARLGPDTGTPPNPGYDSLGAAAKDRYNDAMDGCIPRDAPDVAFPPLYHRLADRYIDMLAEVSMDPQVEQAGRGYPACMAKGGYPVGSHNDLIEMVRARLGAERPPEARAVADPAWSAAVAQERRAARLDVACRRPVYDVAIAVAASKLDAFERDNAADLDQIAHEWQRIVTQAERYPEYTR